MPWISRIWGRVRGVAERLGTLLYPIIRPKFSQNISEVNMAFRHNLAYYCDRNPEASQLRNFLRILSHGFCMPKRVAHLLHWHHSLWSNQKPTILDIALASFLDVDKDRRRRSTKLPCGKRARSGRLQMATDLAPFVPRGCGIRTGRPALCMARRLSRMLVVIHDVETLPIPTTKPLCW